MHKTGDLQHLDVAPENRAHPPLCVSFCPVGTPFRAHTLRPNRCFLFKLDFGHTPPVLIQLNLSQRQVHAIIASTHLQLFDEARTGTCLQVLGRAEPLQATQTGTPGGITASWARELIRWA